MFFKFPMSVTSGLHTITVFLCSCVNSVKWIKNSMFHEHKSLKTPSNFTDTVTCATFVTDITSVTLIGQCRWVKFLPAGFHNRKMGQKQGWSTRSKVFCTVLAQVTQQQHQTQMEISWMNVVMLLSLHTDRALHGFIIWHFNSSVFIYLYFVRYLACFVIFVKRMQAAWEETPVVVFLKGQLCDS